MKNLRALVKECALRVLKEDLSSTEHDRLAGEIYAKLQQYGFQTKGDEPNQYSEYYLWNFATIQCGVRPDHVYVERYYDSERMDDMHRKTQKIPLPPHYDANYVNTVVALCVKWQRSIKGDESIFGGMDDITEINATQDERGKWVGAVGAPGSIARMKVEYPDTVAAMVAALTKRFGPPSKDLYDVIQDASMQMASKILDKSHGIGVQSLAKAAEEDYWQQNKQVAENTAENPKDAYYVEYVGERVGEEPFMLGDRKFQYVNGKYPDGTVDVAVYAFAGDLCYGYNAFRQMMNIQEGFDPTSVGPNPDASEGNSVHDPYASMNAKMRQMEMVGPVASLSVAAEKELRDDIENLKKTHPNLSFGYIGNYESDPRIGDNRSWYVWNVKNGTRQKWGGFDTKDLPLMWKQWQASKAKVLGEGEGRVCSNCNGSGEGRHEGSKCTACHGSGEAGYKKPLTKRTDPDYDWDAEDEERRLNRENLGRYAQEAGALDLKETLELTATGADDDWSRPVYTDKNGTMYVDINCGNGKPSIHTVTDEGEPNYPVKNFKIVGTMSSQERFPHALCPRCKNSKPELMGKTETGQTKCNYCHWQDNEREPYTAGMNPSESKVSENTADVKTFQQIRDEEDPKGQNHDLTLTCVKCGTTETCRCSKPKRKFKGICAKCSQPEHDPKDTWQAAKRQPDPDMSHYMGDGDRT